MGKLGPHGPLVVSAGTGQASAHVHHLGWHCEVTGSPGAAMARLGSQVLSKVTFRLQEEEAYEVHQ